MLVETTNYNRTYSSQYTYENKQTNFGEKLNDQLKANEAGKVDNYNSSNNPVMDLYKDICKAFPNVSFRLDDMSEAMKQQSSSGTYLGYNNSMNQVGNNFGSLNQPSISIDVSVINKALQDPSYKERLMGTIASRVANYDNCRAAAKEQGKSYACLSIEDAGNGIQVSTQCSSVPFATEDEVRRMWSDEWTYNSLANRMRTMSEEYEEKVVESLTDNDKDYKKEVDKYIEEGLIKIKNGETEPTFQIGNQSFTEKEWNKLLEKFDEAENELRKAIEEELKERAEKEENKSLTKSQEMQLLGDSSVGVLKTEEITESASVEEDGNQERVWTITTYTDQGIISKKTQGGKEISSWELPYKNATDAKRVLDFINSFDKNADLKFAGSKEFWERFLSENLDVNSVMENLLKKSEGEQYEYISK